MTDPTEDRDELSADVIDAATGVVGEHKAIQVALEDSRTVVARVRTVQDGDHECPVEGCLKRYDSEKNRQTHLGRAHPEETARTCPECGDSFSVPPSRTQTYCSQACHVAALKQVKTCPACQRPFETHPVGTEREREYCSMWCAYEDRRSDPRPDTYHAAYHELLEDGEDGEALRGRLECILGPEWPRTAVRVRLGIDERDETVYEAAGRVAVQEDVDAPAGLIIHEYVRHLVGLDGDLSRRVSVADVLRAGRDAESLLEASRIMRLSRRRPASALLSKLGLKEAVDSYALERAKLQSDGGLDGG